MSHTEPLPDCVRRLAVLEAGQETLAAEIQRARESSGRMEMTANTLALTLGRLEKVAERYEGMAQRMHDAEVTIAAHESTLNQAKAAGWNAVKAILSSVGLGILIALDWAAMKLWNKGVASGMKPHIGN